MPGEPVSIASDIERVASAAAPPLGWVRIAWRLAPAIAIALLAGALLLTRARLAAVRSADALAAQTRRADEQAMRADFQAAIARATAGYADQLARRAPLIVRSNDEVARYAQTPAGRAPCLDADRVRGIDAFDRFLSDPASAEGGADQVRGAAGPPAG